MARRSSNNVSYEVSFLSVTLNLIWWRTEGNITVDMLCLCDGFQLILVCSSCFFGFCFKIITSLLKCREQEIHTPLRRVSACIVGSLK